MSRGSTANATILIACALIIACTIGSANAGTIATRVLGQPDFVHGAANTVDSASLALNSGSNQHIGVAVDPAGHLYVADLSNNRVLGWHSVSALVTGEPADLVIGQTDFETGTTVGKTSKAKKITLKNASSKNSHLSAIIQMETVAPPFAVKSQCQKTLAPGKSCKFSVTFTPPDTTPQVGTLMIFDNAAGSPQTITLTGTGKPPK